MWPKRVFFIVDPNPRTMWRVGRILAQCNISAELQENEYGYWLVVDDKPNLALALGAGTDLHDYGIQETNQGDNVA